MARNDELDDVHRSDAAGSVPHMDGGGDSKNLRKVTPKKGTPKKKKGTPKKDSGEKALTPRTPSGRGPGCGGANAAATPTRSIAGSATVDRAKYETTVTDAVVTTVEDSYLGPHATAFAILRREGSVRFKAFLQRLADDPQQTALQPLSLDVPQLTGPAQALYTAEVQAESPPDSGIDVLTPDPDLALLSNEDQQSTEQVESMAPVREISQAERERLRERGQQVEVVAGSLKNVIQDFYEVQVQVQGYVSETETRDVLVNKMQELSQSLDHLARGSSSSTITNTFVPPEVVDYLDDGRNPDIYRRELVEVVQRGNAVLNGKMNAFGSFSKIFADDLRKMSPEMAKAVDEIMGESGDGTEVEPKRENGSSNPA